MTSLDNLAEEIKKLAQEQGEEMSDEKAREGANNLVGFFDLLWKFSREDSLKKKRLKKEPDGFPVDGQYSCLVCGRSINETNGWYDWYGNTCLLCRKAIKDGVVPTFVCTHRDSYYSMWKLKDRFAIHHQKAKKYIKEGLLFPRIILTEGGKPHDYIFLKKENPKLIDPDRKTAGRKSYDRSRKKLADARGRKMKAELLAEHRANVAKLKKKYS